MKKYYINPNKKNLEIGDYVMIHSYKYNGWLYRTWHYPIVIDFEEEWTILCSYNSLVSSSEEKSKRIFKSNVTKITFWFLSKEKWFNILVSVEKCGIRIYINVASPFIFEEGAIKYFDFDLDFKIYNLFEWKELDLNEYFENQIKYNYPKNLINKINEIEQDIKDKIETGWFKKFQNQNYINNLFKKYTNILDEKDRKIKNEQ